MGVWESNLGLGIYDFSTETYTNIPNTQQMFIMGLNGNLIYTVYEDYGCSPDGIFTINIDTFEIECIFNPDEYFGINPETGYRDSYFSDNIAISDDYKYMAFAVNNYYNNDESFVYLYDLQNNEVVQSFPVNLPAQQIQFFGNNLLVNLQKYYMQDEVMYIIPAGEFRPIN
jgi:hypothetical protein